jgi:molybdopterin-containing oxidoreductase family iron-sulfur binding subunit
MRYGMVLDLKTCIGCYACQIACKSENATPPGVFYAWAMKVEQGKYPMVRKTYLPMLCMHCENPSCVDVCPTGATFKREEDGIVMIDAAKCVGCRSCMMACPYHARYFLPKIEGYFSKNELTPYEEVGYKKHAVGLVEKCNFCVDRLAKGLEPACVANCPAKARHFGDLDDPESEVSELIRNRLGFQLLPEVDNNPAVYYLPF